MATITFQLDDDAKAAYLAGDRTTWNALMTRISCWARGACCGNVQILTTGMFPVVTVNSDLCADQGPLLLEDGGTDYCSGVTADVTFTIGADDVSPLDPNTCAEPTLPTPTGLAAGATTATSVALTWNAVAGASSYTVEYRAGTSGAFTAFTPDATGPAQTITGLTAGTSYQFRVIAKDPQWTDSLPSATVTAATNLAAPGAFTAGTPTTTTIPLTWSTVAGATSYRLEYKLASEPTTWTTFTPDPTTGAATITGLTADTAYDLRVKALAAGFPDSAYSTTTATTAAA